MKVINFAKAGDDPSFGMDELCESLEYMLENNVFGSLKTESVIAATLDMRNWLNSPERVEAINTRLDHRTSFLSTLNRIVKYNHNVPHDRKESFYKEYLNYEAAERIAHEPVKVGSKIMTPERLSELKGEKERNRLESGSGRTLRSEAPENPFAQRIANMIKERESSFGGDSPKDKDKPSRPSVSPF